MGVSGGGRRRANDGFAESRDTNDSHDTQTNHRKLI
jgi:hypothetical protein